MEEGGLLLDSVSVSWLALPLSTPSPLIHWSILYGTDVQIDRAECRQREFTSRQRGICPAGEGVPCVSGPRHVVLQREHRWARNIRVCMFRVASPIMITGG